jgi:hypothetical protein
LGSVTTSTKAVAVVFAVAFIFVVFESLLNFFLSLADTDTYPDVLDALYSGVDGMDDKD